MCTRQLILSLVGCATLGLATASCYTNSASIEESWRAPDAHQKELHYVVTVFSSDSEVLKRAGEDKLARQLASRGVRAVPGYSILSAEEMKDRNASAAKLRAAGFDGIVVMKVVNKEQQLQYYPGGFNDYYWGGYSGYWGGYGYYGGTVIPETIVQVEIDAFSLLDNKLIWTALSRSVDPDDVGDMLDDVTQVATRAMAQQGVLPPKAG